MKITANKKTETSVTSIMPALSRDESAKLKECKAVIKDGLNKFVEVGCALASVRDGKLYRQSHPTFEAYASDKWNLGRAQSYRLITAAETVKTLSPIGDKPTNESQVRELAKLAPEHRDEVWREASKTAPGGKVTAAHIVNVATKKRLRDYRPVWFRVDEFPKVKTDAQRRKLDSICRAYFLCCDEGVKEAFDTWYAKRSRNKPQPPTPQQQT